MEALKLDGSCQVLNFHLAVVSKLPPCPSDELYDAFLTVAIRQRAVG